MKILVIFTGGTIGSSLKGEWISIDDSTKYALLANYADSDISFETVSPYSILSENLSGKEINILQEEVESNINLGYDGIIIAHGTDTLQYTSCAIEYAFEGCDIPVVFVSSAYPLEDSQANGYANFEAAVEFIRNKISGGVFVSYKNDNSTDTHIHIPSRLLAHSECDANIYSIDGRIFASYNGKFEVIDKKTAKASYKTGIVAYREDSNILCVESYPANNYSYSLDGVKAIILKPYHSATLDTANVKFKDFCMRAQNANIPVFLVNVKEGRSYESAKFFDELKIKVLPYGTFISAYMKIWAEISMGKI